MGSAFGRFLTAIAIILLAVIAAQPYVDRYVLATATPRPVAARGDLAEWEKSTTEIFDHAAPSVVQVVSQQAAQGNGQVGVATGTGFIWDAAGHIVTNNHVVENATRVAVRMATGDPVEAEIIGRAPTYDLAVLHISTSALPPPLAVGTSADLKVGQAAFAIGNPFGLDQSLSSGIVSALKRRLPTSGGREIAGVIQTDAAINPGNSGGPLLDSAGRLIGVTSAIYSPSGAYAGIGFAIPVDIVSRVVPQLIKNGRVPIAGIGILAADETEAAGLGVNGVIVEQTVEGMPAARAGLRGVDRSTGVIGDVITEADSKPVRHLADLTDALEQVGIGKSIKLTVRRANRDVSVDVPVVDVGQT